MATTITAGNATNGAAISSDNTGILELKSGTGSGTTAMTVGTDQAVTFAQAANLPNTFGFKNRIINGAMVIDQRNAGASVTITSTVANTYTLDRWAAYGSAASKFSVQQSSTAPTGFNSSILVTSLAATSVGTTDRYYLCQFIEGFNTADLMYGTANAQTVTLSFWVRSSLTGTFGGTLQNNANDRNYPFTYTINSANTFEQKTITITGDTTGTWVGSTNGVGLRVFFGLGVGSGASGTAGAWGAGNFNSATGAVSVVGTNGATFYITGVQLEKGSTATSFDYRDYGTELVRCQRYCHAYSSYTLGRAQSADTVYGGGVTLSPTMRATPTLRSGATFAVSGGSAGTPQILSSTGYTSSPDNVYISNASANWTVNAVSALTGIFEAEL
jgi:hypothetical protein